MQRSKLNYERKLFLDFSIDCIFSKKKKTKQKRIEMKETVWQKNQTGNTHFVKNHFVENHRDDKKINRE